MLPLSFTGLHADPAGWFGVCKSISAQANMCQPSAGAHGGPRPEGWPASKLGKEVVPAPD
jgi:hypothetical protein